MSITPKQSSFLKRLLSQTDSLEADWFDDLKSNPDDLDSLSIEEASQYIDALLAARDGGKPGGDQEGSSNSSAREPKPASEKQLSFLRELMDESQFVSESGELDIETLIPSLTSYTASRLIDVLRVSREKSELPVSRHEA